MQLSLVQAVLRRLHGRQREPAGRNHLAASACWGGRSMTALDDARAVLAGVDHWTEIGGYLTEKEAPLSDALRALIAEHERAHADGLRAARAIAERVVDEFSENYWTAEEAGAMEVLVEIDNRIAELEQAAS
jgi:1,6-anhydro-N-acetylmuramate kinase